MKASSQDRTRIVAGWVCLLTAIFLYAPLAAASWSAHAMACCTGDYCPIAAHHHRQNSPVPQDSHLDCEQHTFGMMNCSMACCQNAEQPLVTAVAFILPHLMSSFAPASIVSGTETARALAIPRYVKPLFPPPRLALAL